MPVRTEDIREVQILSQGRAPVDQGLDPIDAANGTPVTLDDAHVRLDEAPRPIVAFVGAFLGEVLGRVDSYFSVLTVVEGDTYRLTIDGTDYDYVAQPGDDAAAITVGLVAAEGGAAAAKCSLLANGDGTISVTGVKGQTYTFAASVPAGTGTVSAIQDASTVSWRVLGYFPGQGWGVLPDTARTGVTENEAQRMTIAGLQGLYLEVTSTDGRVRPIIQPALLE